MLAVENSQNKQEKKNHECPNCISAQTFLHLNTFDLSGRDGRDSEVMSLWNNWIMWLDFDLQRSEQSSVLTFLFKI